VVTSRLHQADSVYAAARTTARTETDEVNPLVHTQRAKIASEGRACGAAARDMIEKSLRFATECGMYDRLRLDLVLKTLSRAIANGELTF